MILIQTTIKKQKVKKKNKKNIEEAKHKILEFFTDKNNKELMECVLGEDFEDSKKPSNPEYINPDLLNLLKQKIKEKTTDKDIKNKLIDLKKQRIGIIEKDKSKDLTNKLNEAREKTTELIRKKIEKSIEKKEKEKEEKKEKENLQKAVRDLDDLVINEQKNINK